MNWADLLPGDVLLGEDTGYFMSIYWRDWLVLERWRCYGISVEPDIGGISLFDLHKGTKRELTLTADAKLNHAVLRGDQIIKENEP